MEGSVKRRLAAVGAIVCAVAGAAPAGATEGYFALGYGPLQRGTAGAGVAHPGGDAMAAALNPAAVAGMGRELSFGLELFAPERGYTATGTVFVPPGSVRSGRPVFPIPNFGYNIPLQNGNVLNIAAYGNGGMNTSYPLVPAGCGSTFCGGPAGVDLSQLFVSVTYAGQSGGLSWGISPTFAVQAFEATGLAAFSGISSDPTALTDNGHDWSMGFGLRAGIQAEIAQGLRFGLSGQTKFDMSEFEDYAGLFEGGGDFDIPASVTAGLAWEARPDLTVMLDYQRIFYSGVPAVSNPTTVPAPLGSDGGPGFGWDDVDVVKLGLEWRKSEQMTWRFGYAYATNPIGPEDVTLNILAPGVVEHHLSAGGSWRLNDRDRIDFAVIYAFNNSVTGAEVTPGGPTPGTISIDMDQVAVSIGWVRRF